MDAADERNAKLPYGVGTRLVVVAVVIFFAAGSVQIIMIERVDSTDNDAHR